MPFAPGTKGSVRARFVELVPIAPASVPNGSIFNDSSNSNSFANKTTGGDNNQVGEASSSNVLVKSKQNKSGGTIPSGKIVALLANGGIALFDSDQAGSRVGIGITLASSANDAQANVHLIGANVVGVLTGQGFTPGEAVYAGESPGTYVRLEDFTGDNDKLLRIGYADCAAGAASGTATDLILFAEVVAEAP